MTCPACGIENPPSAQYCDCGHEFVPGTKPKELAPTQPSGTWCPKCKMFNPAANQFCGKCGAAMQKRASPALIGCLGLIGIVVLIGVFSSSSNSDRGASPSGTSSSTPAYTPPAYTPPAYTPPPERPEAKVSIKKWNWTKGGFDTIMKGTFTIRNDNDYAVKDIRIGCELSANSGTTIDSVDETIYDSIPANNSRTFRAVSMGFVRSQTSRAGCQIRGVVKTY